MCGPSIPAIREHEVYEHTMLIDGTEQVLPPPAHLDIGLVYAPGLRALTLKSPYSLLKLGGITMDPAHDRGRGHFHAPLLHHLGQVSVRDSVLAVPTNTDQDDLDWEATTPKHDSS